MTEDTRDLIRERPNLEGPENMTVRPELTDEQARELIRAASIYAREYAGKWHASGRKDQEALAASKRLDAARFELEKATDEAN